MFLLPLHLTWRDERPLDVFVSLLCLQVETLKWDFRKHFILLLTRITQNEARSFVVFPSRSCLQLIRHWWDQVSFTFIHRVSSSAWEMWRMWGKKKNFQKEEELSGRRRYQTQLWSLLMVCVKQEVRGRRSRMLSMFRMFVAGFFFSVCSLCSATCEPDCRHLCLVRNLLFLLLAFLQH